MSRINSKDTKPELILRRWLWHNGYRYRLYIKDLPGTPDIVFQKDKKIIFVHGCFWHKHNCNFFKWPKTNNDFWERKILGTVKRDEENYSKLKKLGWHYFIVWECQLNDRNVKQLFDRVSYFLESRSVSSDNRLTILKNQE